MKHEIEYSDSIFGIKCTCGEWFEGRFSFYSTKALFGQHKNEAEKEEKRCEELTRKYDGTTVLQVLADRDYPLIITEEEEKYSHNVVAIYYRYLINRGYNKKRVAFFKKNEGEYTLIEKNVPYSLAISKYIPKDKEITIDILMEAKRNKKEYDDCFGSGFPI